MQTIPRDALEAYAAGTIGRRELNRRTKGDYSFADIVIGLAGVGLPLPKHRSDPEGRGMKALEAAVGG